MKRAFSKKLICFVLGLCVPFTSFGVFAQSTETEERQNYIVITDVNPLLSPDNAAFYFDNEEEYKKQYRHALSEYNNSIKEEILSKRPSAMSLRSLNSVSEELSYTYTDLLSGFSISLTPSEAEEVKTMDGVSMVIKDEIIYRAENVSSDESVISDSGERSDGFANLNAGNLIGAPEANALGYTGKGRAIAVIDTYINPNHSYLSLSDDGLSNAKYTEQEIEKIIDDGNLGSVKSSAGVYRTPKVPFAYDYCYLSTSFSYTSLHGQHVSGIASGNVLNLNTEEDSGLVRGVAPDSQIIFMGIFSSSGGASLSTLAAALDDAVKFDIDSVNLSVGADYISENYSLDVSWLLRTMVQNAASKGISVIYSSGNSGHDASYFSEVSDYSISDNSLFPHVIKVGSVETEYAYLYYAEDENANIYPCESVGASLSFTDLTDIVDARYGTKSVIDASSGKVIVVEIPDDAQGAINLSSLVSYAASKGVKAVVFINNVNQIKQGSVSGASIPVLYMPALAGEKLLNDATQIKFLRKRMVQKIHSEPSASEFSSFGVSDSLFPSVDFAAPGAHIMSCLAPNNMGNMTGTSMAAPFVTGAVSLLKERCEKDFPSLSSLERQHLIRALLTSTTDTVYEENGALSSVRKVGSGLVRIDKALLSNAVVYGKDMSLPAVSVGEFSGNEFTVNFKVKNFSDSPIEFKNISALTSCDGYKYYEDKGKYGYYGTKALSNTLQKGDAVTVGAGEEAEVSVKITLDENELLQCASAFANGFFVDGKITLSGADNNTDIGVAFTAFCGDWASQKVINDANLLSSTYLFAMENDGSYSYCFPEKTDSGYAFYLSGVLSDNTKSAAAYLVTKPDRNSFMELTSGEKAVGQTRFAMKNEEFLLPLSTLGDISVSEKLKLSLTLKGDIASESNFGVQQIEFDIIEDSFAPEFSVILSDGTAKVSAKDDTLVTTVTVKGKKANSQYSLTTKELDKKEGTLEFDVTGLTDLEFTVYDKAFNSSTLKSGIYFEKTKDKIYIKNGRDEAASGTVYIAVYETDGETTLKNLSEIRKLSDITSLSEFEIKEIDAKEFEGKNFKIFFWDMTRNAYPLCVEYGR